MVYLCQYNGDVAIEQIISPMPTNTRFWKSANALALLMTTLIISQTGYGQCPTTAVDLDGHVYSVGQYGTQCWMRNNLRTSKYSNGHSIPLAASNTDWQNATSGRYSNYDNNASYDPTYGKLYNWLAAIDPRNICPTGWHVPSDDDWKTLEIEMGMPANELDLVDVRGNDQNIGGDMKVDNGIWADPNQTATNNSNFSAYPAGLRRFNGLFQESTFVANFWTTDEFGDGSSYIRTLDYFWGGVTRKFDLQESGFSCRCVYDTLVFTSINDYENQALVSLYPNPASNRINVRLYNLTDPQSINLLDNSGRIVYTRQLKNEDQMSFDISSIQTGIYHAIITSGDGTITRKVIINR